MNSGYAAALDRLRNFCCMAVKAANRVPCPPPLSTLVFTPAFSVYTKLGTDPIFSFFQLSHQFLKAFQCVLEVFNDIRGEFVRIGQIVQIGE